MSALKEIFDPKMYHCVVQLPVLLKANLRGPRTCHLPLSSSGENDNFCLSCPSVLPPKSVLPQTDERDPRSVLSGYQAGELKLHPMFPDPVIENLK